MLRHLSWKGKSKILGSLKVQNIRVEPYQGAVPRCTGINKAGWWVQRLELGSLAQGRAPRCARTHGMQWRQHKWEVGHTGPRVGHPNT